MENYRKYIVWGIFGFILFMGGCSSYTSYNSMVSKDETVSEKWAQVENVYQRRADLIPNLMNAVEGSAYFEKSTFTEVTQARASATQIKLDPTNLTPEALAKFDAAQSNLGGALGRLMVVMEKYPELKSTEAYRDFMTQLEGTENRIAVERREFNIVTKDYNKYIRTFPKNVWAGMFSFNTKAYFEADAGANKAPKVNFKIGK